MKTFSEGMLSEVASSFKPVPSDNGNSLNYPDWIPLNIGILRIHEFASKF
jgi:hypothetical protein